MSLTLSLYVTRTELGLTNLQLNEDPYKVSANDFNPGSVVFRRETAKSPYVDGGIVTGAVKDLVEGGINIDVSGADHSALRTNLDTLITAVTEQRYFDLYFTVNGAEYAWKCDRADYATGFVHERLHAIYLPVAITFTRAPTPVSGPV